MANRRSRRRSSSRCSRLPCVSNSTRIECCCTCPAPARSRLYWQESRSVSGQINGRLPCWLPHEQQRLAHETVPPTLPNNPFTLYPDSGVGECRQKNKKKQRDDEKLTAESLCNVQVIDKHPLGEFSLHITLNLNVDVQPILISVNADHPDQLVNQPFAQLCVPHYRNLLLI